MRPTARRRTRSHVAATTYRIARRSAWLAVVFLCQAPAGAQELPASQPGGETIAGVRQRLTALKPDERTRDDTARLATLDFLVALGESNGPRAAARVDAIGYQPLPLAGDLPEQPARPIPRGTVAKDTPPPKKAAGGKARGRTPPPREPPDDAVDKSASEAPAAERETISARVSARPKIELAGWPAECVIVADRQAVRAAFPAVARWMLPTEDIAILVRPPPGPPVQGGLTQEACLVVRLRGDRATIVGGNLLAALGGAMRRTD